jgi:uncharacterized protein YjhX (UPF0386 family)
MPSLTHFNISLKPASAKGCVHNLVHNGCITKRKKIWKWGIYNRILDVTIEMQKSIKRKKQINSRSGNL